MSAESDEARLLAFRLPYYPKKVSGPSSRKHCVIRITTEEG
jgi:hypothetical protein